MVGQYMEVLASVCILLLRLMRIYHWNGGYLTSDSCDGHYNKLYCTSLSFRANQGGSF
jgi:hypothetical protein